jgi:hypothetical protein
VAGEANGLLGNALWDREVEDLLGLTREFWASVNDEKNSAIVDGVLTQSNFCYVGGGRKCRVIMSITQ